MADPKNKQAPHALDKLVARVGKNDTKLLDAILEGASNEELIADGASIATARIVTDGLRLYGEALDFLDGATDAQKKLLRGVSSKLLGVAVHHLDALRKLQAEAAAKSQGSAAARVEVDEAVREVVANAVALRDQAHDALRDAAGTSRVLAAQVDEAFGAANPPETLAAGLDAMAGVLRKWLDDGNAGLKQRLSLASLDEGYAAELTDAALAVRTAVADAAARTSPKARQAAVDREDGVQILLLGQILRAFEGAHGRDATIPRLVPISTRRLFNRNRNRKPSPAADPPAAPPQPATP